MPAEGIQTNYSDVQQSMEEIADGWFGKVVDGLFEYVGPLMLQEMQANCPVDTGTLRDSGQVQSTSQHTMTIVFTASYATPVDQGHYTRNHTSFVEAQPFFSSVVGRYTGGELIRNARVKMTDHIEGTFSHYRSRG